MQVKFMRQNNEKRDSFKEIVFAKLNGWQLSLGVVFVVLLFISDIRKEGDFSVFYLGGLRFMLGAKVHVLEAGAFTYPTFLAMVLSPLTFFGFSISKVLFFVFSVFSMLVGVRLINYHLIHSVPNSRWVFWITFLISLKYFIAVFQNQQSDLVVFFLVITGIHYYCYAEKKSSLFFAASVLVKTNPFFLVLMPVFQKKYLIAVLMVGVCISGILIPDLVKPSYQQGDSVNQPEAVQIPLTVVASMSDDTSAFYISAPDSGLFSHLENYLKLTVLGEQKKWWHNNKNELNQSLTRITSRYLPDDFINPTWVFLFWCSVFALAMLVLIRKNVSDYFVVGLLFYSAFVLIGPMSSKAHFIAMFGLFVYLWKDALLRPGILKLGQAISVSLIFGFTSKGLIGDEWGDLIEQYGHIGLSSLYLWCYVYCRELIKGC